ncbi:hypothetical protein HDU98_008516 [Podochytrium sp. JEL0797]|nr:hypothetical protein HDU98_008516 [Podochytrium sp. JEL0797]
MDTIDGDESDSCAVQKKLDKLQGMSFFGKKKKDEPAPSAIVVAVARDTEPVNKQFRDHLTHCVAAQTSELESRDWISAHTMKILLGELSTHGIHLSSSSPSFPSTPSAPVKAIGPAPPPLPFRGPSNTPHSLDSRAPSLRKASIQSQSYSSPSSPDDAVANPSIFISAAAKDPMLQKAAFQTAKDPALQKAAYSAYSKGDSPVSLASNPLFQRAALNAAKNPAVQNAAMNAARDPGVQKAAFAGAAGAVGFKPQQFTPQPAPPPYQKTVVAIADFAPAEDSDLSIRVGDLITVLDDIDDNWYRGSSKRGEGIFPKNHVETR